MAGTKHDQDKPMITLVRPDFITGIAQAMTFGAKKYGKYNYREGLDYSRILDAMMRHFLSVVEGVDIDEESGLPHIILVASNANMLFDLMQNNLGTDDRIKTSKTLPERGGITYNAVNPDGSINRDVLYESSLEQKNKLVQEMLRKSIDES